MRNSSVLLLVSCQSSIIVACQPLLADYKRRTASYCPTFWMRRGMPRNIQKPAAEKYIFLPRKTVSLTDRDQKLIEASPTSSVTLTRMAALDLDMHPALLSNVPNSQRRTEIVVEEVESEEDEAHEDDGDDDHNW